MAMVDPIIRAARAAALWHGNQVIARYNTPALKPGEDFGQIRRTEVHARFRTKEKRVAGLSVSIGSVPELPNLESIYEFVLIEDAQCTLPGTGAFTKFLDELEMQLPLRTIVFLNLSDNDGRFHQRLDSFLERRGYEKLGETGRVLKEAFRTEVASVG